MHLLAVEAASSADSNFRAIGLTVFGLVLLGFILFFVRNVLSSRSELGSEIELAANRKEYLSDEDLEGPKLDKSLTFALVMLAILALALPFYWLAEPGRQDGAIEAYNLSFEVQGEGLYTEGAQCVNCHAAGGVGGSRAYVLQDGDGQFVANAQWAAPALNDVLLRYSEEEVRYILNFGRPDSPMAAWGTPGGGPLTTQQVDNIIVYLRTLQKQSIDPIDISLVASDLIEDGIDENEAVAAQAAAEVAAAEEIEAVRTEVQRSLDAGEFETVGEAVFNLGLYSGYQGGSLSCARCHTAGWSLGIDIVPDILDEGVAGCGGGNPSGIGYNLCNGSTLDRFPDDVWLAADGSWLPPEGLPDDEGFYIEAADGAKVRLDENSNPVTDDGRPYLVLDAGTDPELDGDIADCAYVSQLWQPDTGAAFPFAPGVVVGTDADGNFITPEQITPEDVPGDQVLQLPNGVLVGECTIIEMPGRTSRAHYNFVYQGAETGAGYGRGGQSHAGMMPGFGKLLPPDLIQAVVDYERGL
ncbi:MAG: c-type cytochrome [Actinomycetota bacterium]